MISHFAEVSSYFATQWANIPPIERARGSVDFLQVVGDKIQISGWLLHPLRILNRVEVYLNGNMLGESLIETRSDLAEQFPTIAHASRSGFRLQAASPNSCGDLKEIVVIGFHDGRPSAMFRSHRLSLGEGSSVFPPKHLMLRVSGSSDPHAFGQVGLDAAIDLMSAAFKHLPAKGTSELLDWGCGCGRVSRYLLRLFPWLSVNGCDIDTEAIDWCRQQMENAAFRVSGLYPPLPFKSETFDVVCACSVMTHLGKGQQAQWLPEIRRILRKGGLFIASLHGRFAASFFPGLTRHLEALGIVDQVTDNSLDGIAPKGYYRAVFQTPEFTRNEWSEHLDLVEYTEAGLAGFQDLAVLRCR